MNREADSLEREGHRERERAKEVTMTAMTKKFGDTMKHVLPQMPKPPEGLPMYFENVEKLCTTYEVPEELKAKLLLPLLTPRAKAVCPVWVWIRCITMSS